jgi:hypothetical protein
MIIERACNLMRKWRSVWQLLIFSHLHAQTKKDHEVRTVALHREIRSQQVPYSGQKCYCYSEIVALRHIPLTSQVSGHKEDIKSRKNFVVGVRLDITTNQAYRHSLFVASQMTAVWNARYARCASLGANNLHCRPLILLRHICILLYYCGQWVLYWTIMRCFIRLPMYYGISLHT